MRVGRKSHFTSEELLSYLDHECGHLRAWSIRRHLRRCWVCKARIAELHESIAAAQVRPDWPGRNDVERARWTVLEQIRQIDRQIAPASSPKGWFWGAAVAAGAVALMILMRPASDRPAAPLPAGITTAPPRAVLERIRAVEQPRGPGMVEQRWKVTLVVGDAAQRHWELWSEQQDSRFAMHWRDPDGVIRNVLYRRESRPAASRPNPAPDTGCWTDSLAECFTRRDVSLMEIEAAFRKWVKRERWEPVSLADEMSSFANRKGARLQLSWQGDLILLTAAVDDVVFVLACDAENKPRWAEIRRGGPRKAVMHFVRAEPASRASREGRALTPAPPRPAASPVTRFAPTEIELRHAEVEAICLLNRLGVDRSEFIKTTAGPDSVAITGLVSSEVMRTAIASDARALPNGRWIRLQLHGQQSPPINSDRRSAPMGAQTVIPGRVRAFVEDWIRPENRPPEKAFFTLMGTVVDSAEHLAAISLALGRLEGRLNAIEEQGIDDAHRLMARRARAALSSALRFEVARIRSVLTGLGVEVSPDSRNRAISLTVASTALSALALELFSSTPGGYKPAVGQNPMAELARLSEQVENLAAQAENVLAQSAAP